MELLKVVSQNFRIIFFHSFSFVSRLKFPPCPPVRYNTRHISFLPLGVFAMTRADIDINQLYSQMMDISNQINLTGSTSSSSTKLKDNDRGGEGGGGGDGGAEGGGGSASSSPGPVRGGTQLVIKTSDSSVL